MPKYDNYGRRDYYQGNNNYTEPARLRSNYQPTPVQINEQRPVYPKPQGFNAYYPDTRFVSRKEDHPVFPAKNNYEEHMQPARPRQNRYPAISPPKPVGQQPLPQEMTNVQYNNYNRVDAVPKPFSGVDDRYSHQPCGNNIPFIYNYSADQWDQNRQFQCTFPQPISAVEKRPARTHNKQTQFPLEKVAAPKEESAMFNVLTVLNGEFRILNNFSTFHLINLFKDFVSEEIGKTIDEQLLAELAELQKTDEELYIISEDKSVFVVKNELLNDLNIVKSMREFIEKNHPNAVNSVVIKLYKPQKHGLTSWTDRKNTESVLLLAPGLDLKFTHSTLNSCVTLFHTNNSAVLLSPNTRNSWSYTVFSSKKKIKPNVVIEFHLKTEDGLYRTSKFPRVNRNNFLDRNNGNCARLPARNKREDKRFPLKSYRNRPMEQNAQNAYQQPVLTKPDATN